MITDRKAFRLCIAEADCDKLLDESKWPSSIVISAWYYRNPTDATGRTPVRRGNSMEDGVTEISNGQHVAHIESMDGATADNTADNTVIYRAGAESIAETAEVTQQHVFTNDGVAC